MKNKKCFECSMPQYYDTQVINGRCDKCHKINEEIKSDKEYWRRRKLDISSEASLKYTGFN